MKPMSNLMMKALTLLWFFCLISTVSWAQATEKRPSPAEEASGKIGAAQVTINYSSPAVKDRKIWGDLVPFGKVWRTGANEATVVKFDQPVMVEGKKLAAGEYGLFTIPNEKEWTVVFNSVSKQWGAFKYDEEKDVLRVKVSPKKSDKFNERMLFEVKDKQGDSGKVVLLWENLMLPIAIKPAN